MKQLSFSFLLGWGLGALFGRALRGAFYWDWKAWLIIGTLSVFIYLVWIIDPTNDLDEWEGW